ncbi:MULTISPECIES: hypothetical protein [unclassified Streptomyces]|uniref:hypothetical protein n=1 Tax=unclassified Streptomyces TaxID=2593676 RepID=UPI002E157F2F|nr:hypothetical protein OG452_14725 [Streptomyces sp. NBC_01197]WSS50834.1 hypothetical protein OG708_20695 [Streptomyces sp. NBC_01180]
MRQPARQPVHQPARQSTGRQSIVRRPIRQPIRRLIRQFIQRPAVIAAAVGGFAAIGIVPATAAPTAASAVAPAAAPAATPASICGSGYREIDSHIFTNGRVEFARVHLLYNSKTGYNCVVTDHSRATAGMSMPTGAWLDVQGDGKGQAKDQGRYSSYAGPVRLKAANSCVQWGGMIEAGVGTYTYTSPWTHCG